MGLKSSPWLRRFGIFNNTWEIVVKKLAVFTRLLLFLSATVAPAGENPLLGTWKMKSFVREVIATGNKTKLLGEHPDGYLNYSPDGRMYAIGASDNRIKPGMAPTEEEQVKLYQTLFAYAGTYTLDGDKVIHHVDISWNQAWTGTDQIRFYKLDGNILTITTAPAKSPPDGLEAQVVVVWEKVKAPNQ